MLNRFAQSFCNLMVLGVALTLTAPALAGPTSSPSPTATPTVTPTASPTMTPPFCGNGVVDPGEECDPPLTNEGSLQCSGIYDRCVGGIWGAECSCGHVDIWDCEIDKKCSVGGSDPADQCDANPGDVVTYTYIVGPVSAYDAIVEVTDDQLGVVAAGLPVPLFGVVEFTATTTIFQTTTNTAWISSAGGSACVIPSDSDSVTVTVAGGPTPTVTPTSISTPTPPPTPTASPSASPTAPPLACDEEWVVRTIYTIGKGQSAANNAKVLHQITGNIIDPDGLCPSDGACSASRIPVCAGTGVTVAVTDSTGAPTSTNVGKGDISCVGAVCTVGAVNVTEKYKSVSADGKDTDRITLLPK